jgi:hypothetical protein
MSSIKFGAEEAILFLLRPVNGLQLVVYCPIWVKFGIRALHATLLGIRVFSESHRGEGRRA